MFTNFQLSTLKNWGFIYWSYVIEDPEDSSLKFWNKTWQHIVNFGQFHFGTSLDNNVKKTKNYSISDFLISEVKKCFKKNCYTQCFKKINNFHFTEKPKTQTRLNSIYLPPPGILAHCLGTLAWRKKMFWYGDYSSIQIYAFPDWNLSKLKSFD